MVSKLVVHVPHASTVIPDGAWTEFLVSRQEVEAEALASALSSEAYDALKRRVDLDFDLANPARLAPVSPEPMPSNSCPCRRRWSPLP